jgi:hydrogenase maturation factor
MITKRTKTQTGYQYVLENETILNGLERVCLVTTNKGRLGRYAGVFVGFAWCEVSRNQAASALRASRKATLLRKEAA